MSTLPAQVTTATITADLTSAVVDVSGSGLVPAGAPLAGQVTFTPDRVGGQLLVPTATPPLMVTVRPMPFALDATGALLAKLVVIPGSTYTVSFSVHTLLSTVNVPIASFSIGPLVAGQTYELASLAPVAAITGIGTAYIIGATGPIGLTGLTGLTGATGSSTATAVTAANATITIGGTVSAVTVAVTAGTFDAAGAATAAQAFAVARANHTGTESADVLTDGTTIKAFLATERTKLAAVATLVGTTETQTLTNKRVTSRVGTIASSATPTPDSDNNDLFTVTALAVAATFAAPTGTPTDGQRMVLRIKDNATARALSWNVAYRVVGAVLPTTTVATKTVYVGCVYNGVDALWDVLAVGQQA